MFLSEFCDKNDLLIQAILKNWMWEFEESKS